MWTFLVSSFLTGGNRARRPTTVSDEGKDKEGKLVQASYQRSQLSTQSEAIKKKIDPAFIYDQYWVALPVARRMGRRD